MNSIFKLLKQIKNLLPYLAFIAIYFFFINIEAKKEKDFQKPKDYKYKSHEKKTDLSDKELRVTIPVIPYKD